MKWIKLYATLLVLITAGGCGIAGNDHTGSTFSGSSSENHVHTFNDWVDCELLPYVEDEMARNTWLKGRPFKVVAMRDDEILPEISNLSAELRKKITDRLAMTWGVIPVWNPARKPWKHHRNLAELQCHDLKPAAVYIGLDCRRSPINPELLQVSVRALDLQEKTWVPGFGIAWSGPGNPPELAALAVSNPDEHLLGLRPFPMNGDQADLVAEYLAENLSCLVRESGEEDVRIYQHITGSHNHFVDISFRLVDNYLNKFRDVTIVENPEIANILLKWEFFDLGNGLHQLWIQCTYLNDGKRIPGTDTGVYVNFK